MLSLYVLRRAVCGLYFTQAILAQLVHYVISTIDAPRTPASISSSTPSWLVGVSDTASNDWWLGLSGLVFNIIERDPGGFAPGLAIMSAFQALALALGQE
jgi:hypothetical protein